MGKIEYILDKNNTQNILLDIVSQILFALDQQIQSDEGTYYKLCTMDFSTASPTNILENANTYEKTFAALKQVQYMAEEAYIEKG